MLYIYIIYSLEGESTSVTLLPSAKTAYPVTGLVFSFPPPAVTFSCGRGHG